ncbi:MAG: hypothetical protein IIV45_10350 [Lachnospiraceae bacterium]|nr:hypothetical protein [Lachnospiraceae bacterium]
MEDKLLVLIKDCETFLDEESLKEVMHFYLHGEYEMSLEGLMIEMINGKNYPTNISVDSIKELVVHYRLNTESVFCYNFWEKFSEWIAKM